VMRKSAMQPGEWSRGISDIEGKATKGGASERGQRASFNPLSMATPIADDRKR
jgi:hypothetical protein